MRPPKRESVTPLLPLESRNSIWARTLSSTVSKPSTIAAITHFQPHIHARPTIHPTTAAAAIRHVRSDTRPATQAPSVAPTDVSASAPGIVVIRSR